MSSSRPLVPPFAAALALLAAIAAVYAGSLRGGFLWDDNLHVTENPTIIGPLGLKEIWTTSRANYFPLVLTNFKLQHALWGLEPAGYRVVTLACHMLAALLLWRVLIRLRVPAAWLGAALWALHPVQVESVAWICELKNTQSAVFFLAAIWCWLRWLEVGRGFGPPMERAATSDGGLTPRPAYYALALLCAVLAILSKPSTVMLPVALGLGTWWVRGRLAWRDAYALAPFLAFSALAAGWTIWEQKFHSGAIGPEWEQTGPERVAIAGRVVWFYLGKLAWPEPLIFIYPRWAIDAGSVVAWLPLAALVATLGLLVWRVAVGDRQVAAPWKAVLLAALYFGALLFPVLGFFNVYFFRYSYVGDHFQYLASMGPLALLAAGIGRLPRAAGGVVGGGVALALALVAGRHTATFRDMETLWRSTVALNPGTKMAWLNLGDTYSRQRRSEEAIAAYRRGLEVAPNDAPAHNDLGCELVLLDRAVEALPHLERAVQLKPTAEHISNLGNGLRKLGRVPEAIAQYERALQLDPEHAAAHNNLGAELAEQGKFDAALGHFETALRLKPKDAATHENVGQALLGLGRAAEAQARFAEALRLDPGRSGARKRLADALFASGKPAEAFALLEAGVKLAPGSPEPLNHLATARAGAGEPQEAIPHFQAALRLAPNFVAARMNLATALGALGRWAEAAREAEQVTRMRPELAEAHIQLAIALVNAERVAEAVAPFETALRLRPESAELHDNFGRVLNALGRRREAFEHLEEAARLRREGGGRAR